MSARGLSAADLDIWHAVAATVTRRMPGAVLAPKPEPRAPRTVPESPAGLAAGNAPAKMVGPKRGPAPEIDRSARRKLAAGKTAIDARLDLHGFRQAEAHARLQSFLLDAQKRGRRTVLVITGKGGGDPAGPSWGGERGVLRRLVPLWLGSPRLAPLVAAFGEAGRSHGGEGALYIVLRRPRERG